MAKLPKRIIKKYGISKKAWSVFRNEKKNTRRVKTSTRSNKVAKKKSFKRRAKTFASNDTTQLLMAAGYGAARSMLNNTVKNVTSKFNIPVISQFGDEATLLATQFVLRKFVFKSGVVNKVLKAGMLYEAANIGQQLQLTGLGSFGFGGTSNEEAPKLTTRVIG